MLVYAYPKCISKAKKLKRHLAADTGEAVRSEGDAVRSEGEAVGDLQGHRKVTLLNHTGF